MPGFGTAIGGIIGAAGGSVGGKVGAALTDDYFGRFLCYIG